MTSYSSAVEQLLALGHELPQTPIRKFDLAHMRVLCRALREPQCGFPAVLIAGTNGKGSTASTLASIFQASGLCTGLYTSPHLVRVNERIRVNLAPIADEAFAAVFARVLQTASHLVASGELPHLPSFFEMVTAMAFVHFAEEKVDAAVLEVGMGGRLDATNIVDPVLSIITDIDLDHQKYLGNTIAEIAGEKAGILRAGVPAVTLPQLPEANRVLGERMIELGARAVSAVRNVASLAPEQSLVQSSSSGTRFRLSVLGREVEIVSPLVGRHQLRNLALAITAAEELAEKFPLITAETIARGVRETRWPARFQRLAATPTRPEIVLDVAHNPAGAWALHAALSEQMAERPLVLLFAAMADKAIEPMAKLLWPRMSRVVLTHVGNNPRASSVESLAALAAAIGVEAVCTTTVEDGLRTALSAARELGPTAAVVIAGSIYLAGEVLPLLEGSEVCG
ncbi:MAG: bifunctional folylpolyglutamate synthase/dihydrofolate synthase [Acidobacteriota bacterium]|nr:bifunctional folylpolyglutamate synthase/dihydrofolate synthase [Acidobacteriota bacterium]